MTDSGPSLTLVPVRKPEDVNVIIGQSHFIKTVEDLHEAIVGVSAHLRFGIAFCEASGDRLVRTSGNDDALVALAAEAAGLIGAGHCFVVMLAGGFPVSVLGPIRGVAEVCTVFCATANEVDVVVASSDHGRGVVGVIDGESPLGVEDGVAKARRHDLLRSIGYKL